MADSVCVIIEEWNDIQTQIKTKVDDINATLEEFREILNDLATNGFIENGAHDSIVSFKGNVDDIKGCLEYIHKNISDAITDYVTEVESTDHNKIKT